MTGKGIKRERETIINFNEEEDTASVWTASETVCRRLKKFGYIPTEDNERSATFKVAKQDIKLPRPRKQKQLSEEERERRRQVGLRLKRDGKGLEA